jgi:hypothetical protein
MQLPAVSVQSRNTPERLVFQMDVAITREDFGAFIWCEHLIFYKIV